jgi:hypothetical protein
LIAVVGKVWMVVHIFILALDLCIVAVAGSGCAPPSWFNFMPTCFPASLLCDRYPQADDVSDDQGLGYRLRI